MKKPAGIALVTLAAVALAATVLAAEIQFSVKAGEVNGSAKLIQRIMPDKSKYISMTMTLSAADGSKMVVLQESTYDSTGKPTRKLVRTGPNQALVTFEAEGAQVRMTSSGKTSNRTVPYPKGSVKAISEFWFLTVQPKKGEKNSYFRFNVRTLDWTASEAIYVGPTKLKVGGKTLDVHEITLDKTKAYIDSTGNPVKIVDENLVMERI